jgi:hypothetical protein
VDFFLIKKIIVYFNNLNFKIMKKSNSSFVLSLFISKRMSPPVTEEVVAEAKSECYSSIKSKDTVDG